MGEREGVCASEKGRDHKYFTSIIKGTTNTNPDIVCIKHADVTDNKIILHNTFLFTILSDILHPRMKYLYFLYRPVSLCTKTNLYFHVLNNE